VDVCGRQGVVGALGSSSSWIRALDGSRDGGKVFVSCGVGVSRVMWAAVRGMCVDRRVPKHMRSSVA
jgi:hypothetical protein